MTGYTVHTGSNLKFTSGWDRVFSSGKPKDTPAKTKSKSAAKKQTASTRKTKSPKAAKPKSAPKSPRAKRKKS